MKNIKERIDKIKNMFKGIFEKFPITILVIYIITIFSTIVFDTDLVSAEVFSNIMLFSIIFGYSTFLIETTKKDKNRVLYYIFSAILALILTYLLNIDSNVLWISNDIFLLRIARLVICYIISILVIAIYNLFKNSNQYFEEYLTHVSSNIFKLSIIYGLLAGGIAAISSIFIFLILDVDDDSLIARIEILLLGLYYIPTMLYAFYDVKNEIGKFVKVIIKYVLNSLVIIAFAIIYLYMAKILILRDIPSNQIYRIIASLFIVGCPIWTMSSYFNENTVTDKITKKLPILFIPFILLQIYTIGIRIISNGFTEARYICVMLIVFEIIYIILYLKSKEKIGKILLVFVVLLNISVIVPYVNMYKVSTISQYNYLKIYKEKTNYTQKEKERIKGAYDYLSYSRERKKLINELLTRTDIDNIKKFDNSQQLEEYDSEYLYATKKIENLNIEGYKTLKQIDIYNSYNDNEDNYISTVFKNIKLNNGVSLDLSIIMVKYILHGDNLSTYLENNYEYILNENQKVIITKVSITYDEEKQTIDNYSIEGYLLEK